MAGNSGDDFDRDILDIIPERFDADADSRQARAGSRLRAYATIAVAVAAVGGIVAAGWSFLGSGGSAGPGIPVIKADERPIKLRPDDRGGMQVPNQDKLVYERMEQGDSDSKVERLLPPPEQPVVPPKSAPADGMAKPLPGTEILRPGGGAPAPVKVSPTPAPVPVPATAAPAPAPAPAAAPAPAPVATPKPVTPSPAPVAATPAPVAATVKAPPPSGDWLIQLGALRSAPDAEKEWGRIQRANADLLSALKSDVVRVELGEKGVFWRLRAGPLSELAAKQLCTELKTRNQGCIVARK